MASFKLTGSMPTPNLKAAFGVQTVEMTCPECQQSFAVHHAEATTDGNVVQCPSCHKNIVIRYNKP